MRTVTARLVAIIVLLVVVSLGSLAVKASLKPPAVEMPKYKLAEIPYDLGEWKGQDGEKLANDVAVTLHAQEWINRVYRHPGEGAATIHCALFADPAEGVQHTPTYCYRGSGWRLVEEHQTPLELPGNEDLTVSYSTWERGGRQIRVIYWFQMGNDLIFNRFDLGKLRWKLRGQTVWPALVKVLFQEEASETPEQDEAALQDLSRQVYTWLSGKHSSSTATP